MNEKTKKPEDFLEDPKTDGDASELIEVEITEEIDDENREDKKKDKK